MVRLVSSAVILLQAVSSVKIDSITTSIREKGKNELFVQIKAGDLIGWGMADYNNEHTKLMDAVADKIHAWVGPHVLGETFETAADLDHLSTKVWRKNYKRTGAVLARALAGVDTALWDLVARSQNRTVCSLLAESLGSECRSTVPVYGSNCNREYDPEECVDNAVHNRDTYGVRAFKFQIAQRMGGDVDIKPGRTEKLIPLARQALGPDVVLMADANGGYDNFTHAKDTSRLLVENNFTWFEEPFPFWEYDQTAALAKEMPLLPIALGEQEYRLDVWERNIHAMRYAQPDLHYNGGMSRALRVVRTSIAANIKMVPHGPGANLISVFNLNLMAASPNAAEFMEFDAVNTKNPPTGTDFFTEEVFKLRDGALTLPTGPGWGVTLKPGLLKKSRNQTTSHMFIV